jgi:hypothetical protein
VKSPSRTRYRIELTLAALSAFLLALTLAVPEWIEELTGLEPDAGSGALELGIALAFLAATLAFAALARAERRRLATVATRS